MKNLIVIPARMESTRFPNKPMAIIDGKPMIQRVWEQAVSSQIGDVIVACCEKIVFDHIVSIGGIAKLTNPNLPTGTDRVFAAIQNITNINQYFSIINLQGDMPLINSNDIAQANLPLHQGFDIGSLVTNFRDENEVNDKNITKAKIEWIKKEVIGKAIDFSKDISSIEGNNLYHHVGIYSFQYETLKKFISLQPSKNESQRRLEQMRALDAKMTIGVGYVKDVPFGVDTKEDLLKAEKIIKNL
jgi:3-deoxy-manno-octulosonate cytidylyltransferase (CMP-KDO synthetase)